MVSDIRHVERVIWNDMDRPRYEGDSMLIQGEPYGKRMAFSAFCREADIDLDPFHPPDLPVVAMERDYFCPIRKRNVLYLGCA